MFKFILLFILICIFQNSAFSQEEIKGEIEYTITFNAFNREKLSKMSVSTRALLENASPIIAILSFSKDESVYQVKEGVKNDAENYVNITRILAGNKDLYYFNRKRKRTMRETSTTGTTFLVEYPALQWKILDETREILNMKCYKAILVKELESNEEVTAWFTPEISLGYGPLHYNGLPGLILNLETSKGDFTVNSIKFDKSIDVSQPRKGKIVSKKEYDVILRKTVPSFFEINK